MIENAHIATVDGQDNEYVTGHVVIDDNRITAVGPGPAPVPEDSQQVRRVDATGCLVTPGLINTHHHLYQWATRGHAVDDPLFDWLTELYPVWAGIDEHVVHVAASAALSWLARTGCTTSTDHHYVFPREGGDVFAAEVEAARRVGMRFHPTRGSMDLGRSDGGLPPDEIVEDRDTILESTAATINRWHDNTSDAMLRVAVAPCSPFSVTTELMTDAATLAREHGVLLHTHLAETQDEDGFCRERFGCSPLEYVEQLGWFGEDVWYAHGIWFDDAEIARIGSARTGVAHCPSSNARLGAGIARVRDLRDAGARVGLGVDGAASNEASSLLEEVRHAVLFARAVGGPEALAVRDALRMATLGGAAILGRADDVGSLEPGKVADVAVWRLDTIAHADIIDPVAALVLGSQPPLDLLVANGEVVVERDRVVTIDEDALAHEAATVHRELMRRVV